MASSPSSSDPSAPIPQDQPGNETYRRLPPVSLVFRVLEAIRSLFVPVAASAFYVDNTVVFGFVAAGIAIPTIFFSGVRWLFFHYRLDEEELVLRTGILNRNERHVPYQRIQNIDLEQNPLHRALKVAKVRLETASGGKPEAVLSVLELDAVEELRDHVFRRRRAAGLARDPRTDPAGQIGGLVDGQVGGTVASAVEGTGERGDETEHEIYRAAPRDLVTLGLISNQGMLVVAAALGLAEQTGQFDILTQPEKWLGPFGTWLEGIDWKTLDIGLFALYGAILLVLFLGLTRLLSIGWMLVKLWGFELVRRGDDLRTAYGSFTRITATIPRKRIQLVSWHESVLHQILSRASIQVETAGGGGAGGDDSRGAQQPGNSARLWLTPIVRRDGLQPVFDEVLPQIDLDALLWHPISARATGRLFRRRTISMLIVALLAVPITVMVGVPLWIPFVPVAVALPLLWWSARRYVARSAYALTPYAVYFTSGAFGRRTSVVPIAKIQVVHFVQNLFDRRARMARVKVDTAGANLGKHRVVVPYLELGEARTLASALERRASETTFRW